MAHSSLKVGSIASNTPVVAVLVVSLSFSVRNILMLSHEEIDDIITDLLESVGIDSNFCKIIRDLRSARFQLAGSTEDDSGQKTRKVISALAKVQRSLVEETDLRQERELATGIKLAAEKIEYADYLESIPSDGYSS